MGGERERQEPSFSEEELDAIDSETGTPVDLEQLLNEIDNSLSATASPRLEPGHENRHEAEAPSDEPGVRGRPEQPALDFGEAEQRYAGECVDVLPDSTDDNMIGEEMPMSRNVLMAGGAVVALSLLCGVAGLFVAFNASGKIEALQQSVDALQTKLATMQVSGDPRVGQLQAEQAGITSRLDELAQGLSAGGGKATEADLIELRKRLDTLEHRTSQASKPAVAAAPASGVKKNSATKTATSRGDWTVVMKSFSSSTQAESEKGRLQKVGISAEVQKSLVDGKPWYRVRVPGYVSKDAAKAAISSLEKKSGISGAWAAHR